MLAIYSSTRSDHSRPTSRLYINTLNERIIALEKKLKERSATESDIAKERNPLCDPTENNSKHDSSIESIAFPVTSSQSDPGSQIPGVPGTEQLEHSDAGTHAAAEPSPKGGQSISFPRNQDLVNRLLSTKGSFDLDQLSGRLKYYGVTTNCHVRFNRRQDQQSARRSLEHQRRSQRVIGQLSDETHDYLMNLFWQNYNIVLFGVSRAAFEEDLRHDGPYCSQFLHLAILAMGYRYAEKTRPDMVKITSGYRESMLHEETKYMVEYEIDYPCGPPTIAALLLLGDLECSVGRDNVGWIYSGIANRLCFEFGLHLNRSHGLSKSDNEVNRTTMFSCLLYDIYWAVFLGRPTGLKHNDLETYNLSRQLEQLGQTSSSKPLEVQIYEALLDLMEIAAKIIEIVNHATGLEGEDIHLSHHTFMQLTNLHRESQRWHSRLPSSLQWTPENISSAPTSFFLLYQQYHVNMILLYRPFMGSTDGESQIHERLPDDMNQPSLDSQFPVLSRTICKQHAIHVARVFEQYRVRFNVKHMFVSGMQHAGTAATALATALIQDPHSSDEILPHMEILAAALKDLSEAHHPSENMSVALESIIFDLCAATSPNTGIVVPARRSGCDSEDEGQFIQDKRHQAHQHQQHMRLEPQRLLVHDTNNTRPSIEADTRVTSSKDQRNRGFNPPKVAKALPASFQDDFVLIAAGPGTSPSDAGGRHVANPRYPAAINNLKFSTSSYPHVDTAQSQTETDAQTLAYPVDFPQADGYTSHGTAPVHLDDLLGSESLVAPNAEYDFLSLLNNDEADLETGLTSNANDGPPSRVSTSTADTKATTVNHYRAVSHLQPGSMGDSRRRDGGSAWTMAGLDDLWALARRSSEMP